MLLRVAVLTAILLVVLSGQVLAAGSATPDEAVAEYMAGVAATDAGRVLDASAIDEMAEGYRIAESVDRLQAFMPHLMLAPAEYPFYVEANRAQRADEIMSQVLMLAYGLLSGETIDGSPIVPVDKAWAEAFVARVDPARLAGIEVMDARFPHPDLGTSERYLQTAAVQAATYGADELTERLLLQDNEETALVLRDLRAMGVTIALDDFGTGYSSLSYLARLPIQGVKIDQRFVRGLEQNRNDEAITQAIIALSHSLGLRVIAEGVETAAQLDYLKRHGCEEAQGFLIARPLEEPELRNWWRLSEAEQTAVAPQADLWNGAG